MLRANNKDVEINILHCVNANYIIRNRLIGDADGNGEVNVSDALLAMRFAMGLIDESELNLDNADLDENGEVNMSDAISILRIALGLE